MTRSGRWAEAAAALPTSARAERERPFWRAAVAAFGWKRVADAGCGAGFHVAVLRDLGVEAVGFDSALAVVNEGAGAVVGDVGDPPLRRAAFDAVLCLGNTVSLLDSRPAQRRALASLAGLVRAGGVVLLQGEDVGAVLAGGPIARMRSLADGAVHIRLFERRGRRVRMLAGVARPGADAPLEETVMLPTSFSAVLRQAAAVGLAPVALPAPPPGGGATWWAALSAPSP